MRTCTIEGCGRKFYAKELCNKHYQRKKIYGDAQEPLHQRLTGLSKTIEYSSYTNMIARCVSPRATGYHLYGGRGIKVCERWLGNDGFSNFINDMGPRPSVKHSIDRIDVNGDYEPDNCRWVDAFTQARNRRVPTSNESKVTGVTRSRDGKRWKASIWLNYKNIFLGEYKDMNDAIKARKDGELKYWTQGDTNA